MDMEKRAQRNNLTRDNGLLGDSLVDLDDVSINTSLLNMSSLSINRSLIKTLKGNNNMGVGDKAKFTRADIRESLPFK